jgi:hypothetical protein
MLNDTVCERDLAEFNIYLDLYIRIHILFTSQIK